MSFMEGDKISEKATNFLFASIRPKWTKTHQENANIFVDNLKNIIRSDH